MKKLLVILFLSMCTNLMAQEKGYVFIEATPNVPYEVIIDGVTSNKSDGTDYLVIPQVTTGKHTLSFKINGSKEITKSMNIDVVGKSGTIIKLATDNKQKDEIGFKNSDYMSLVPAETEVEKSLTNNISKEEREKMKSETANVTTPKAKMDNKVTKQFASKPVVNKPSAERKENSSVEPAKIVGDLIGKLRKVKPEPPNAAQILREEKQKQRYQKMLDSMYAEQKANAPKNDNETKSNNSFVQPVKSAPLSKLAKQQAAEVAKREAEFLKKQEGITTTTEIPKYKKPEVVKTEKTDITAEETPEKPKANTFSLFKAKKDAEKNSGNTNADAQKKLDADIALALKKEKEAAKQNELLELKAKELKAKELKQNEIKEKARLKALAKAAETPVVKEIKEVKKEVEPVVVKEIPAEGITDAKPTKLEKKLKKREVNGLSNCKGLSTEQELVELFQKLEAKEDDYARLNTIRKTIAKTKTCYTCKDIEQLCQAFNTQSGKYDFVRQLFPYVQDEANYQLIENAFKYESYKQKVRMEFGGE